MCILIKDIFLYICKYIYEYMYIYIPFPRVINFIFLYFYKGMYVFHVEILRI